MYKIEDFSKLHKASHIIWDIDGTITDENGKVNQEVAAKILNLASESEIYHSFVTGRDAGWIIKKLITPMKDFAGFMPVHSRLAFFAEVGCVVIEIDNRGRHSIHVYDKAQNHPLYINTDLRNRIRTLAWDPEKLKPYNYQPGSLPPPNAIFDADYDPEKASYDPEEAKNDPQSRPNAGHHCFLTPDQADQRPKCPQYIWSTSKMVYGTFEKVRTSEGKWGEFDQSDAIRNIQDFLDYEEVALGQPDESSPRKTRKRAFSKARTAAEQKTFAKTFAAIDAVSTAINIVPKLNGEKLGKSWGAANALESVCQMLGRPANRLHAIIDGTIAFGDGDADLDFTTPYPAGTKTPDDPLAAGKALSIVFVGDERQLPPKEKPRSELRKNIVIMATGEGDLAYDSSKDVVSLKKAKGARVVSAVLDFLKQWNYFQRFPVNV